MNTLITFIFWYTLVIIILKMMVLAIAKYPRKQEVSINADVVSTLLFAFFFFWVILVKYGVIQ